MAQEMWWLPEACCLKVLHRKEPLVWMQPHLVHWPCTLALQAGHQTFHGISTCHRTNRCASSSFASLMTIVEFSDQMLGEGNMSLNTSCVIFLELILKLPAGVIVGTNDVEVRVDIGAGVVPRAVGVIGGTDDVKSGADLVLEPAERHSAISYYILIVRREALSA